MMKRDATRLALLLSFFLTGLGLTRSGCTQTTTPAASQPAVSPPSASQPAAADLSTEARRAKAEAADFARIATSDKMAGKPSIEIHPEFFLGWTQSEQTPPPPKRLPWPLKITLTAVNASNEVIAGPMSVTTTEELVGSRFRKVSVIPPAVAPGAMAGKPAASAASPTTGGVSSIAGGTTTVSSIRPTDAEASERSRVSSDTIAPSIKPAFTTSPASTIQLQELEFASLVDTRGAGFMNLKCFIRLTFVENDHAEQVQTLTTVECRPDRETTLATFGGLSLKILVAWNDTTE